ncbi:cytoplasmic 60S subunit biogenesis factor ZNF622 [Leptidea sinapis]|uniref:cytoplasmic 60S subunit biogenesis factor ZNF622 n=1 Tax=Leptidea sinapis TaxID=189913 RepID=UPI0021290172|nr:cytoplasmic 60S subunit biogenesis factor ZNF622 [Leptidea sinapis]
MPENFTCITCQVVFISADLQREHYKLDWHRYNLKRKVAGIPPVTLEEFELRAKEHREQAQNEASPETVHCKCCSKTFNTKNAFNNHLNSKKHKLAEQKSSSEMEQGKEKKEEDESNSDSFEKIEPGKSVAAVHNKFVIINQDVLSDDEDIETDSEIEELDSDEWEECRIKGSDSLIKPKDCLFCGHHSKNMMKNVKHMSVEHSFFIPDVEYCTDIKGLLLYLGEKISQVYMCLWCNDAGKTFYSMEAARAHMLDKGHCKMLHEGLALAEYSDYYDYSASYPQEDEDKDMDVDVDEEVENPAMLEADNFQLVLPSGAVVGHRSLLRYYKQHLNQNTQVVVKKSDRKLHRLLGVYRGLGWAPKEQAAAVKKARDIHFMKRVQAKWQMKMSLKNNKFQKHYREQVNF